MADAPTVLVDSVPFVLVAQPKQAAAVIVAAGGQGPPGRDGVDGATISPDPDNQIDPRPNGLYVPPLTWQSTEW